MKYTYQPLKNRKDDQIGQIIYRPGEVNEFFLTPEQYTPMGNVLELPNGSVKLDAYGEIGQGLTAESVDALVSAYNNLRCPLEDKTKAWWQWYDNQSAAYQTQTYKAAQAKAIAWAEGRSDEGPSR